MMNKITNLILTTLCILVLAVPYTINAQTIEMVFVQGGTFTMGCTSEQSDCEDDEKPEHGVSLSNFSISKYEVTQAQWESVMGSNPSWFSECPNCPVESVSWNDIQEFLRKLNERTGSNYRLPTEAEWEYAARGGDKSRGYQYSGSNNIDNVAWNSGNSELKTHPVGEKQANELGLYDMSGNVYEWCQDWYDEDYYSNSPSRNPEGPISGDARVTRGGSWGNGARNFRIAERSGLSPDINLSNGLGFRLARSSP
ncbi:MAG: formylglycine-generating enzyme family protein [Cyclobacteriaceae bacterium]|nr:formylglycine-generating enzyme family protein [Cyclobacteriaceae bacterium]